MEFNPKERVLNTIADLAAARSERDVVWKTLYVCIDLARALDRAHQAYDADNPDALDVESDVIDGTLVAILSDLALWQGELGVARGTEETTESPDGTQPEEQA